MANNYYDATGVLVLDKVTPVITALFGAFKLDATYPGNGQAYIAKISEDNEPSWEDILGSVCDLAATLGQELPDDQEGTIEDYLYLLATHYGADDNEVLGNLIEHNDFHDDADLGVLFDIAKCLDDGHGLKAMKIEGCWHCSRPRLFEFGGNGEYYGRHFFVCDSSSSAISLGEEVDNALDASDLDKGADCILKKINSLLAGVSKAEVRETLRAKLSERLAGSCGSAADVLGVPEAAIIRANIVTKLKWFAVNGCLPGDDEDTLRVFQAADREEALAYFEVAMYEDMSVKEAKATRKRVWNEHGQYVFVNSIVSSASPIDDIGLSVTQI